MRKREDYKRFITFCLASVVVIAQAAIFAYVWYDYYRELIYEPFWQKGNWVLIGIYAAVSALLSHMYGGLRVGYLKRIDVFYSMTLATVCTNIFAYFEITLIDRWFLPPLPMLEMTGVQILVILVWIFVSRMIYSWLYQARNLLVIYGDRDPGDLIEKMNSRSDKYNVCAKVNVDRGDEVVRELMEDYDGVIIWDLPSGIRNRYLKYCFEHSIRCYMSPKISDIILTGSERIHLFDTPLLLSRNMGLSLERRAVKRLFDILVSFLGIVILSPLLLIIALAVKLQDGGPVLYRQDRLTRGGKEFSICKFRSMRVNSETEGAVLATVHDERITKVGHVLRNLHLDELPQLFNVLKGDMSLVGPRPERKEIMEEYQEEIPEFPYRLKVKAGLTGYAQVYGKYNTTPYDKLKLDLFYIENFSLFLDLKLIFMTVRIFFQKEVSEGVEDDQKTALKSTTVEFVREEELTEGYSVLMPVYEKETPEHLRLSIRSMEEQTLPFTEFVLVCDGPLTKALDQVVEEAQKRIGERFRCIRLPRQNGLGYVLDIGVKACRCQVVARMDSDDISRPGRCEKEMAYIQKGYDLVGGGLQEFWKNPQDLRYARLCPKRQADILRFMKRRNPFNHPTVMFRRKAVLDAGSYQKCPGFEDYHLWVRMLRNGAKAVNLQDIVLDFRIGSGFSVRRGGREYARSALQFEKFMLRQGIITRGEYIRNCAARTAFSLLPGRFRSSAYMRFLRN